MPGNSERRGRRTTAKKGATDRHRREEPPGAEGSRPYPAGRRAAVAQGVLRHRAAARAHRLEAGQGAPGGGCRGPRTQDRPPRHGRAGARRRGHGPASGQPRKAGPRVAPGRRSNTPPGRARSCWSGATRWSRRCARTSRPPRSTSPRASTSTTGSREIVRTGGDRGIALIEVTRVELDRMTGGVLHQGVGLQVPPFAYEPFDDLLAAARSRWRRCWWRWTASPTRATSAPWCARPPRSARTACSCPSGGPPG